MSDGEAPVETEDLVETPDVDRLRAVKFVAPFLAIGLFDVLLLLFWGIEPLWGFMILPPILFMSALAWVAFRTGFVRDR